MLTAPCTEATVFNKGFLLKVVIVGARFHEVVEKPDEHPPDQQDGRVVGDELLPVSLPASSSLSSLNLACNPFLWLNVALPWDRGDKICKILMVKLSEKSLKESGSLMSTSSKILAVSLPIIDGVVPKEDSRPFTRGSYFEIRVPKVARECHRHPLGLRSEPGDL